MTQYEMLIRAEHEALPEEKRPQMTAEHFAKKSFVEGVLTDCLHAAEPKSIEFLTYEMIQHEEIVTVHFVGGGTHSAFVTGDSKLAIIEDVMKVVY